MNPHQTSPRQAGSSTRLHRTRRTISAGLGLVVLPALILASAWMLPSSDPVLGQRLEPECTITATRKLSSHFVNLGESVAVTLFLQTRCYLPDDRTHVLIAIDASERVGAEAISQTVATVNTIADETDLFDHPLDRAGILVFNDKIQRTCAVGSDADALRNCLQAIEPKGESRLDIGITEAVTMLRSARALNTRLNPNEILFFLSDGRNQEGCQLAVDAAQQALSQGILVMTAGIGEDPDEECGQQIASSARYAQANFESSFLVRILETWRQGSADRLSIPKQVTISERLPKFIRVDESSLGDGWTLEENVLSFKTGFIPREGHTLTFTLHPLRHGTYPTSLESTYRFRDNQNNQYEGSFPIDTVHVAATIFLPRLELARNGEGH